MKRREALLPLSASIPAFQLAGAKEALSEFDYANPYQSVDWETWETVHSMSHQHQGMTEQSLELFHKMGYRHFAFSNYYPSAPTKLLPSFREGHSEIVWAPNAEQHSFLDTGLHFNSLGSRIATGYGSSLSLTERQATPISHRFENVTPFDAERPWEGVYRLDLQIKAVNETDASATLSIEGAHACDRKDSFADQGPISDRVITDGNHTIYLRSTSDVINLTLTYESEKLAVAGCRLMQGTNRPWRDAFVATFANLLHPDGGGITLNHPTGHLDDYLEMLDFDPRVLGIEVWNQLTSGFGSDRGFYHSMESPPAHFYGLWDQILATGRRCWGFFVKDHNTYGRGRNILLAPPLDGLAPADREAALLRAYRDGAFFGSVAAINTGADGLVSYPYDQSDFRFRHIRLRRDDRSRPIAIEAAVTGADPQKRPNVQIRFVMEKGVSKVVDAAEGSLEIDSAAPFQFVRVEALAYPNTHNQGEPLDAATIRALAPAEISQLHDRYISRGPTFFGNRAELRTPVPIVDQIFSQPILRRVGTGLR